MRLNDLDRATAARRVDANDRARRAYVKEAYGVNGDDPELYQLMIDAVTLGVDVCVDMIVAAAESRVQGSARGKGDTGARRASAP
jgi:cytidylate kinase